MSEGLPKQENDTMNTDDEDGEYRSINPPVKNKKKDLKQRRKKKEQQQLKQIQKATKVEKRKVADIHKLKFLKKQIEGRTAKLEALKEKHLKAKELKLREPKRLGKVKFEEEEIYFNNIEDISGNLRNLKKEGSLLTDRYKSLQRRNILQPSVVQTMKRAKVKRFTRPGHKDDWKVTVAKPFKV